MKAKAAGERNQAPPQYMRDLEDMWRANRDKRRAENPEGDDPWPREKVSPKAFVDEIVRCGVLSGDPIFFAAVLALRHHGFINESGTKFLRWRMPIEKQHDEAFIRMIHLVLKAGNSRAAWVKRPGLRYACAFVAAHIGFEADTFESASKRLEIMYAKSEKKFAQNNSQDKRRSVRHHPT